ncbi:hypothetical protein AB9P05_23875 [Roseivirga sp. BDSF3-8]|uniref:hypothetical protein n=1 Tax=Roseivirga sp. BDSF3-8 TaxID=3241598 RepID=UPI0035322D71
MLVGNVGDTEEYDYSTIYETIKRYYPPAEKGLTAGDLLKTKEYERYNRLLRSNFQDKVYYKEKWKAFKAYLKGGLDKPVRETTAVLYPCYSGAITIEKKTSGNLTYIKELHFFISLLGPYYSLIGLDRLEVTLPDLLRTAEQELRERNRLYHSRVALTISPCYEYERPMKALARLIGAQFPEYRQVPFALASREWTHTALYTPDSHSATLIFHALFGRHFPLTEKVRGDETAGCEDWRKES